MVAEERARRKKWAAPPFALLWFDDLDRRVRLTVENMVRYQYPPPKGWRVRGDGRPGIAWVRIVELADLPRILSELGHVLRGETV